jgi:predicted PurR-regulated permease PerM
MTIYTTRLPSPRRIGRWLLILAALYGVGWLLWQARASLLPFVIGAVLAYMFLPLVNRLEGRVPRWAAILIVYALVLGLVFTFFAFIVPPLTEQFGQLIQALPDLATVQAWADVVVAEYRLLLSSLPPAMQGEVEEGVAGAITQGIDILRTNFLTYLRGIGTFLLTSVLSVANTVSFLLGFFLIPFWLFYVLMDQRAGRDTLDRALPGAIRADFWSVVTIVDHDFSGYLRGQLILGVAVGSASAIGLTILNLLGLEVPYVLILAVVAGITELIPLIGPILGSIPAIILGFMDSPTTGLAVLALYVAIQQLENNFLVPRIVGESVGLHPAVLMILLVVCAQVFGVIGAILSAPLGAVFRDVFQYLYGRLSEPPTPAGYLPARIRREGVPAPPEAADDYQPPPEPVPPPSPEPLLELSTHPELETGEGVAPHAREGGASDGAAQPPRPADAEGPADTKTTGA